MRATIVDLRYRMKAILSALDRGETVIVLYRGKEKATLKPIASGECKPEKGDEAGNQPMFGMWRERQDLDDPAAYVRALRERRILFKDSRAVTNQQKPHTKRRDDF